MFDEVIFALDIGTRSVIGLIGYKRGDQLEIKAVAIEEYDKRAVIDGQIEDIRETAKVALKVKQRLEAQIGRDLTQVYIAAAGRVLKTGIGVHEAELSAGQVIDAAFVAKMEFAATQSVYENMLADEAGRGDSVLCVGHAVTASRLDGYAFSTLVGHKGRKAEIRVIATFLPKEVVESLNSTMTRIGLTVVGLTLEPIAAINAVIPPDLRTLNLALVDIGAGTADIAVCEKGNVSAFTMATVAGDEVTEAIMEFCLTDFRTAEDMKKMLGEAGPIPYTNILGFASAIDSADLYAGIKPAIQLMVDGIGERISSANLKAPAAVFLVGGGSQLPHLDAMVATALGLEESRVVVGGATHMRKQAVSTEDIFGPEFATPLGIAVTASERERDEAFSISVNEEKVSMLGAWDMTVLDALQMAGFKYEQIIGRAGRALIYVLNGERQAKRGGWPSASTISRNDEPCALSDKVEPGDKLLFVPALPGEDAALCIEEVTGPPAPIEVSINGIPFPAGRIVHVQGKLPEPGQAIKGMDEITWKALDTLGDLCRELDLREDLYEVRINGMKEKEGYALRMGDRVEIRLRADEPEAAQPGGAEQPDEATQPGGTEQGEAEQQEDTGIWHAGLPRMKIESEA